VTVSFVLQQKESRQLSAQIETKLVEANIDIDAHQTPDKILRDLNQRVIENRSKISKLQEDRGSPLFILGDLSRLLSPSLRIDMTEFRVTDDRVFVSLETTSASNREEILRALSVQFSDIKDNVAACSTSPGCVTLNLDFARSAGELEN
jgi:hypothetical protein